LLQSSCPEVLEHFSRRYVFPKGVELFRQGFAPDYIYHLEAGLIKLTFDTEDGHEVIIGLARPGCILGVSEAVVDEPHVVSALTVQRSWLRCVGTTEFIEELATNPRLSILVNRLLSREVSDILVHSVQLAVSDARSRLEQLLWNLVSNLNREGRQRLVSLQLPISHEEIARLIAVTPQYLSRLFSRLTKEGVLRKHKASVIVIDTSMLRHSPISESPNRCL
jgi:CRP/FNR family transcriptional regulator